MAVFTSVSTAEFQQFLTHFNVGELVQARGVTAGVENTNYFVDTSKGHYVLTLFENVNFSDLPFFIALNQHLIGEGITCPAPMGSTKKTFLHRLKDKPAVLWQRLWGKSVMEPTTEHCHAMGIMLAKIHMATKSFPEHRQDPRGPAWWQTAKEMLVEKITPEEEHLITEEIAIHREKNWYTLPGGIIHTDCFRDNVLFESGAITGILDLFNACYGPYLYDLAICVNDWCIKNNGLDEAKLKTMLAGYESVRKLEAAEKHVWADMLRAAALRFWLSRLIDERFPKSATLVELKDPKEFQVLLERHRQSPCKFKALNELE